jgi:hypothetical protein
MARGRACHLPDSQSAVISLLPVGFLILPESCYIASARPAQKTPPLLLKRVFRIIA